MFDKSRLELYEKIANKNKKSSGEISDSKFDDLVAEEPKTNRKRKYGVIPNPSRNTQNKEKTFQVKQVTSQVSSQRKGKEGELEVGEKSPEKKWKNYVIPKKKPALEAFHKIQKGKVQKDEEKDDPLFDGVKKILEGLESAGAPTTTTTDPSSLVEVEGLPESPRKSKLETDEVTTISDTTSSGVSGASPLVRDKEGEEGEISVVGGSVSDKNQEKEEEEITVLGGTKSRSESPQIVLMTKDIPECGVKVTLTKSPPILATNRRRKLTGIPKYSPPTPKTIKEKEDIRSDDEFSSSQ